MSEALINALEVTPDRAKRYADDLDDAINQVWRYARVKAMGREALAREYHCSQLRAIVDELLNRAHEVIEKKANECAELRSKVADMRRIIRDGERKTA